jgi:putative transposase
LLDPVVSEYSISLAPCRLPSPLQRPWPLFWPNAPALTKFMVLFLIDLSTRRVAIAGIAIKADRIRMDQVDRNLRDAGNGFLMGKRYLIHDRDLLFTAESLGMLADCGAQSVKLAPRSPKLNAHAERFVRTIKESRLTG